MQYYLLIELYNTGKGCESRYNIMQQIMSNIEIDKSILKSYDPGHFKKKAIPKFLMENDSQTKYKLMFLFLLKEQQYMIRNVVDLWMYQY